MKVGRAAAVVAGVLSLGAATFAVSQQTEPDFARLKPVNLRVLPQDISARELGRQMKGFEADLGVTCSHCHVQDTVTRKFDYASDENPDKTTARLMITMLKDINDKYLAELGGDRRYAVPVTCGSCHQGQSSPPPFEPRYSP
ncbi:MAG TPA: c-type cytochrome [Steroidobacteraceae bacterium]|jgi:hypothetical protein|nr:c-type cytochrome [Steroidobacteraceae bacterium]